MAKDILYTLTKNCQVYVKKTDLKQFRKELKKLFASSASDLKYYFYMPHNSLFSFTLIG